MAQLHGFPYEEKALKRTMTELYVAKGKVDKAVEKQSS